MPFWDDDGTTGWAEKAVEDAKSNPYARKTPAEKPTQQAMADAWNANRNDPAKLYELMQQNGVGVNEVAKMLGVGNNDVAKYLNTGRSAGKKQTGFGDDMNFVEEFKYAEVHPEAQTKEEFMATVEPWMLDAQGKFKRPHDGVNYRWEGMTPDEVYAANQPLPWDPATMERDGNTKPKDESYADHAESKRSTASRASWDPINLKWEPGPDNGGGILGGFARAVGNMGTAIADNPALMAGVTAGVGSMMAPAAGAGATAGGVGTGGSAGIGSGTVLGGGSASVSPGIIQTVMSSPYARPIMNAGRTLASGGDLGDAALAAGGSYLGGETSDALGGGTLGQVGGAVVSGVVSGRDPLKTLVSAGINAAAGEITGDIPGFEALSQSERSAITSMVASALKGQNPTKALIANVTNMATSKVAAATPRTTNFRTRGWAE